MTFPVTQNPTPPTVFNIQASNWVHCEEETGVYYQLTRFNYKWVIFIFLFLNLFILRKKMRTFQKNSIKYIHFFSKRDNLAHVLNAMINSNLLYL